MKKANNPIRIATVGNTASGKTHILYDLLKELSDRSLANPVENSKIIKCKNALNFTVDCESRLRQGLWLKSTPDDEFQIYSLEFQSELLGENQKIDGFICNIPGSIFNVGESGREHFEISKIFDFFHNICESSREEYVLFSDIVYNSEDIQDFSNRLTDLIKAVNIDGGVFQIPLKNGIRISLSMIQIQFMFFLFEATDMIFCWDVKLSKEFQLLNTYTNLVKAKGLYSTNVINVFPKIDMVFNRDYKFEVKSIQSLGDIETTGERFQNLSTNQDDTLLDYSSEICELYQDIYNHIDQECVNSDYLEDDYDWRIKIDSIFSKLIKSNEDSFHKVERIDPFTISSSNVEQSRPLRKVYFSAFPVYTKNHRLQFFEYNKQIDEFIGENGVEPVYPDLTTLRANIGILEIMLDIIHNHFPKAKILEQKMNNNFKRLIGLI